MKTTTTKAVQIAPPPPKFTLYKGFTLVVGAAHTAKAGQHTEHWWNFICHPEALAEGSQKMRPRPRIPNTRKVVLKFNPPEVLITLGIIGVVAAMTIPTLISNYQDKQTVTRLTKAYATISNAYTLAKVENGDITNWGFAGNSISGTTDPDTNTSTPAQVTIDNTNLFLDKLSKYLKVSKRAKAIDINYTGYFLSGEPTTTTIETDSSDVLILTDGTTIKGAWISNYKCTTGICGDFNIDINGPNTPPNTFGKDIFVFYIYKNGIVPMGRKDETSHPFESQCNPHNTGLRYNGYGCTAWVIYNKNLDYLHCDDLSWDGKLKCD